MVSLDWIDYILLSVESITVTILFLIVVIIYPILSISYHKIDTERLIEKIFTIALIVCVIVFSVDVIKNWKGILPLIY